MKLAWLRTNDKGTSYWDAIEVPMREFGGPDSLASPDVDGSLRVQWAPPAVLDYHPAPRRQLVVILTGGLEIELADGSKRQFRPGELFLADDTTGQGHITRDLGGPRETLQIGLPATLDPVRWST